MIRDSGGKAKEAKGLRRGHHPTVLAREPLSRLGRQIRLKVSIRAAVPSCPVLTL